MKFSSKDYWERRYKTGGNSGVGSYDKFAEFKAEFVNSQIKKNNISSIIEFGVGDGNQLAGLKVEKYTGLDVSSTAIEKCIEMFSGDSSKSFYTINEVKGPLQADMTLSMDVVYHLVEDEVFEQYMIDLFKATKKFVIIYSSNTVSQLGNELNEHVKHRRFSDWIEKRVPSARLIYFMKNRYPYNGNYKVSSFSDFYMYQVA